MRDILIIFLGGFFLGIFSVIAVDLLRDNLKLSLTEFIDKRIREAKK